ncbi:MAG: cyclase family protein [Aridibacter sp.]
MIVSLQSKNKTYKIDSTKPINISIPLKFNGEQPNAYGVEKAKSKPCEAGELVGDTRQGGSCNFEQYRFIPHCNGTHTECVGHITNQRISINDCLQDAFISAALISVEAKNADETDEIYSFELNENDKLITRKSLQISNFKFQISNSNALIIRTLPNDESNLTREYGEENIPPFFSNEALEFIIKSGVKHLLVDLPSIDRIFDGGKLSNHRKFWNVADGKFETNEKTRINSTITELIYVPNEIKDGNYLLNLQIAAFESDASPSRPLLFEFL